MLLCTLYFNTENAVEGKTGCKLSAQKIKIGSDKKFIPHFGGHLHNLWQLLWVQQKGFYILELLNEFWINSIPDHNSLCVQRTYSELKTKFFFDRLLLLSPWEVAKDLWCVCAITCYKRHLGVIQNVILPSLVATKYVNTSSFSYFFLVKKVLHFTSFIFKLVFMTLFPYFS